MRGSAAAEAEAEKGAGDGVEITELEKFEPTRVDGVKTPANGFPILMMKSVVPAAEGDPVAQKDASADCGCAPDCGCRVGASASAKPAGAHKSAYAKLGKQVADGEAWPDGTLAKLVSADQRRAYADQGVAMPSGDFPIPDKGHLKSAIGHWSGYKGDKAAAKKHIIKRAKKLGLTRLLPDDWEAGGGTEANKGAILTVEELKKSGLLPTPDAISKAVTEALAPSEERFKALEAGLAKVLATPIPGGPQLVTTHSPRPAGQHPGASEAARLREIAAKTSDPDVRQSYLDLAAQRERATPKD